MKKIIITRGKDATFVIRLLDNNGDPVNLTGWSVIKARFLRSDNTVLVKYAPLTTAVNEVQKLTFSAVPTSGAWRLKFGDEVTASLNYDAEAGDIQAALNALYELSNTIVTGDYNVGFTVTFSGNDGGRNQPLLTVYNSTLKNGSSSVTMTVAEITAGVPVSGIDVTDATNGKLTIKLSESDTAVLREGLRDLDLIVRIGTVDLNIPPQVELLDIRNASF